MRTMGFDASKLGDPCLCGDKTTWHPECYRKQSEEKFKNDPIFRLGKAAGRAQGYREGQEAMRERVAGLVDRHIAQAIRDLPIEELPLDKPKRED